MNPTDDERKLNAIRRAKRKLISGSELETEIKEIDASRRDNLFRFTKRDRDMHSLCVDIEIEKEKQIDNEVRYQEEKFSSAAAEGNLKDVKTFLKKYKDNMIMKMVGPMHRPAQTQHFFPAIDYPYKDTGITPLITAAVYGHERIVLILLQTDKHQVGEHKICYGSKSEALKLAAERGHKKVVETLLKMVEFSQYVKDEACALATQYGHEELIELFNPKENKFTNSLMACFRSS